MLNSSVQRMLASMMMKNVTPTMAVKLRSSLITNVPTAAIVPISMKSSRSTLVRSLGSSGVGVGGTYGSLVLISNNNGDRVLLLSLLMAFTSHVYVPFVRPERLKLTEVAFVTPVAAYITVPFS